MQARGLVAAGGIAGACGVALSAAAAHGGGDPNLSTAANFLLVHAPALLVLGLMNFSRAARTGGLILLAGLVLFCGDLAARHFLGARLFPFAAPVGGSALIAGWLVVALSCAVGGRR